MNEIISFAVGKLLDAIPAFLLRLLFKPANLASKIRIGLRGDKPICPNLDREAPSIDLYFDIINLSNFTFVLDRLLIELWFGQPTLNGAVLKRSHLAANSILNAVYFHTDLTEKQCAQIRKYLDNKESKVGITLYVTGYLESKVGLVEVSEILTRENL